MKTVCLHASACRKVVLVILMLAACVLRGAGQGFVNLNFEDAGTNTILPNAMFLDWSVGAPGWQHAGVSSPFILHTTVPGNGLASYFLVDSNASSLSPIDGAYSLALINGHSSPTLTNSFTMTWIAQIGTVPTNAQSFELLAMGGPFSVSFNGTKIPMVSLGGELYGGNVSEFAGQSVSLLIQNDSTTVGSILILDDGSFTPTSTPEPGTLALLGCGLAGFVGAAVRHRSKAR